MEIQVKDSQEYSSWINCKYCNLCEDIVLRALDKNSINLKELLLILDCPSCDRWRTNEYDENLYNRF